MSESFERTPGALTCRGVFEFVSYASPAATGASLTFETLTETFAVSVPPLPSSIV
jgi:hypothetical protein